MAQSVKNRAELTASGSPPGVLKLSGVAPATAYEVDSDTRAVAACATTRPVRHTDFLSKMQ